MKNARAMGVSKCGMGYCFGHCQGFEKNDMGIKKKRSNKRNKHESRMTAVKEIILTQ